MAFRFIRALVGEVRAAVEVRRHRTALRSAGLVTTGITLVIVYIAASVVLVPTGQSPAFNFSHEGGAVVAFNLFFNNRDGNFSDINSPVGNNATLNTAAEINSLAENSDNIVANPRFLNPDAGDFRLSGDSPAIDAGTNTDAPATDFAGNSRPIDGDGDDLAIVDMGAFEFSFVN